MSGYRFIFFLPIIILALALAHPAHSATLMVSKTGDGTDGLTWETAFPTIGEAIVASTTGDEVWIRSGTYPETITLNKPLKICGGFDGTETLDEKKFRNGQENPSIVDGSGGNYPVISINLSTVQIEGISVRNGMAGEGSGFHIKDSNVVLEKVNIINNGRMPQCHSGGGISVKSSSLTVKDSTLSNNSAVHGGGLSCDNATLIIHNSNIVDNNALYGAGIRINRNIVASIDACVFSRNVVIFEYPDVGQIGSGGEGGAIGLNSIGGESILRVENSIFDRNTFRNAGAGTIFHGVGKFSAELENCTCIVGSRSTGFSLGGKFPPPVLENCVVVSELNSTSTPIGLDDAIVSHSLVEGGYPGEGNIDADPKFVDFESGDLHLQRGSPCIDSGTDTGLATDYDGNPRPVGRYDMGAYE
ncbi:MAG: hypothetical protein KC964_31405, partial [Candidatus Omnitrophica bacterium]|nr:hypothetical protein [Candidatus Omnitrophota bacterium]